VLIGSGKNPSKYKKGTTNENKGGIAIFMIGEPDRNNYVPFIVSRHAAPLFRVDPGHLFL
jgi:hypothetical protein